VPRLQSNPSGGQRKSKIVSLLHRLTTHIEDIRDAQKGDREAYARLYDRYNEPIVRFVMRRGAQQADADNVAQEIFLHLLSGALRTYDPAVGRFKGWLTGVIRQKAHRCFKKTDQPKGDPIRSRRTRNAGAGSCRRGEEG